MAKMNVWKRMFPVRTHEGAVAQKVDAKSELRRTVLTCLLWEATFYEKGNDIAKRIAALAAENKPEVLAALAREARTKMQLRHAPLFLARELARRKGAGPLVAETLESVIQRADELGEFVALYWKEKKQPLSAGVKRGLARAFTKFDAYELEKLAGLTGLVVDVSGSMNYKLAKKGETTRIDAAAGLAILLREKAEDFSIATFSDACVELPPRRGFALRDAIVGSQAHSGTYLKRALTQLYDKQEWRELERLIVITDEQSHDGILRAWTPRAYVVNVAPYKHGISYGNNWMHIDGWSERIVDYITAVEAEPAG